MDAGNLKKVADELALCYDDPLRFVIFAFPWGQLPETRLVELQEPWASRYPGCKYGPDAWACRMLDDIGAAVRERNFDGQHAVDPIKMAVASGRGIGKSCLTAFIVLWILATRPYSKGVVTANTASQLETKTWAEIVKWLKRAPAIRDFFEIRATSILSKEAPESWRVDALTCKEENAESFAGQHAASSTQFYIFDEASGIPEAVYDVAEGSLTDGEPMMFLFGNPTRNSGRFFECFHKRSRFWNTRSIDGRDVALTNKGQLEAWRQEHGENSDFFKINVKGEFPSQGADQFIPRDLVLAAMARGAPAVNHATCAVVGVDIARFGDDDTVIATRIGRDGTLPVQRYNGLSTVDVAGKVKQHIFKLRQLGLKRIHVFMDEGGVGGGPVDILRADGFPVQGVNFSQKVDDPELYPNKREEMWGRFAEWLKEGALPDDRALEEDIVSPTYKFDVQGRRKLESKADMKKRGMRSPDAADAYALTFAVLVDEYGTKSPGERSQLSREARMNYNPYARMGYGSQASYLC